MGDKDGCILTRSKLEVQMPDSCTWRWSRLSIAGCWAELAWSWPRRSSVVSLAMVMGLWRGHQITQSQFEEMPIAVPLALAWRGRISGTYTLEHVNAPCAECIAADNLTMEYSSPTHQKTASFVRFVSFPSIEHWCVRSATYICEEKCNTCAGSGVF